MQAKVSYLGDTCTTIQRLKKVGGGGGGGTYREGVGVGMRRVESAHEQLFSVKKAQHSRGAWGHASSGNFKI